MRKITPVFVLLLLALPSVSSAAALTSQQANSLIAVVQSSPSIPASAFVSLITAFSNITVNQATSLITVVQAAPSTPASAFVDLLTSFTVDIPPTQSQNVPEQSSPVTKGYYENGTYVYLTDAEHQVLLQQLQSTIQSLKNKEQPYIDDLNKAESEIQKDCASIIDIPMSFQQGNAQVTARTQASICASTSQAYTTLIQIDRQAINYYEAKIQSLESSYN